MSRVLGIAGLTLVLILLAAPASAGTLPSPSQQCAPSPGVFYKPPPGVPWAQQALDYSSVWKFTQGAGVKVAVIDSGVDANSQFGNRVQVGGTFADAPSGPPNSDCLGHGTMVAGIIGAAPTSSTSFAGVAPRADILSIKVTNSGNGIATTVLAQAIEQAVLSGSRVINISVITPVNDRALRNAIEYAIRHQTVVIAPVGNDQNGQSGPFYPASYPGVLPVGAVNSTGALTSFSDRHSDIGVTAPGADVTSTFPSVNGNTYAAGDSTSYAAAFVSGLAALIWSRYPSLTSQQVVRQIEETADGNVGPGTGNGLINPVQAVTAVLPSGGIASRASVKSPATVLGTKRSPKDWTGVIYAMGISAGAFMVLAILAAGLLISPFGRSRRTQTRNVPRKSRSPAQPHRIQSLRLAPLSSILVAVAVAGVFGILRVLSPGNDSGLDKPNTLVTDSRTGTFYIPCDTDRLCRAINETSALLALKSISVKHVTVNDTVIAQHKIGPIVGIPGAPQNVPAASSLVKGPWGVCTQKPSAAGSTYTSSVLVGGQPVGGSRLHAHQELFVSPEPGSYWLLEDGERLLITGRDAAPLIRTVRPLTVPMAWLDTIPEGPDLHVSPFEQVAMAFILGASASPSPSTLCVSIRPGSGLQITIGGTVPAGAVSVNTASRADMSVDKVWLPPGKSALVGIASAAGQLARVWYLISGTIRYALAGPAVAPMLGYNLASDQTILPSSWLWLLPQGPGLDPTAASQAVKLPRK